MAAEKSPLTIVHSQAAIDELAQIWRWNAEHYSVSHADEYLHYLQENIANLAGHYASGRAVGNRPDLYYIMIRRRPRGHGHVVVYKFDTGEIHILHVFHTAQDWQTKLREEQP